MGVGWAVGGMVVGTGVVTGWTDGEVHPLMQSIRIRAAAISPYMRGLIESDMELRYIILSYGSGETDMSGQASVSPPGTRAI
jgi:hypothetical protein